MPSGHGGGSRGGGHFGGSSGGTHFGGSHRSSGGSHFGGFSSGGGSNYRGGRRTPRRRGPGHGPNFIFFGRRHYYSDGTYTNSSSGGALTFLFIFIILVSSIFAGTQYKLKKDNLNKLDIISDQRDYYLNMINTGYHTTGKVTNVTLNYDYDKYFIDYRFITETGHNINGYSFCMYDSLLSAPSYGSTITIYYDSNSSDADSIPGDYKNFSLEQDGEYVYYQDKADKNKIIFAACIGVDGSIVVIAILLAISYAKKNAKAKAIALAKEEAEETAKAPKYCEYCGSKVSSSDAKCSGCGANLK